MEVVGFWKRVLMYLLDLIILMIPFALIGAVGGYFSGTLETSVPIIVSTALCWAVWIWLVCRFGGTPGKLLLDARIINSRGYYPTFGQALLRSLFPIIYTLTLVPELIEAFDMTESTPLMDALKLLANAVRLLSIVLLAADCLTVAFNGRKQAIHDIIAKTFVVQKPGAAPDLPPTANFQ